MRGTIKWFEPDKGFGWITLSTGEDVYVHGSALRLGSRSPDPGLEVDFELTEGPGGKQAYKVRVAAE